jgi:ribosomal protein L37AE/L43A
VVDEWSQGIEFLHRSMTWQDLLANMLGVVLAVSWIWAFGTVGGVGNRLRLERSQYAFDTIFMHWKSWFIFAGVFLACAVPMAMLWPMLQPTGVEGPLLLAIMVWAMVTGFIWRNVWNGHLQATIDDRACFACGRSCGDVEFDEMGAASCPACGNPLHVGQWLEAKGPPLNIALRQSMLPAFIGLVIFFGSFAALWASVGLYDWLLGERFFSSIMPRFVRLMGTEKALMQVVDFAAVFVVLALVTRMYRRRLASHYDRPFTCHACGHDLRGTPTDEGLGRCGECGRTFARAPEQAGTGYLQG